MKNLTFTLAAIFAATFALAACSKGPEASSQPAATPLVATPPAASAQPGQPPCGSMCEANYVSLKKTGLANFGSAKQSEFSAPLVIGTDKNGNALEADPGNKHPVLLTADWWTDGGTLRIGAASGVIGAQWSPYGAQQNQAAPAPSGVHVPAGWYVTEIWCASKQCKNVALTVDGKPVVPYSIPSRQP